MGEATQPHVPIYTTEGIQNELRQAEIISGLKQYSYDGSIDKNIERLHPFVVISTQDCDLLWDYESRLRSGPEELNGVLLHEMEITDLARTRVQGSDLWKRIVQNRDDRYHALQAVPSTLDLTGAGIGDLIIDFKRYFTLPASEIYRQVKLGSPDGAVRRCRVEVPYREHLQSRLAFYFQRVGLPVGHKILPVTR